MLTKFSKVTVFEFTESWSVDHANKLCKEPILSRVSFNYFGTSEFFSGLKKEQFDGEANWSGFVNFSCMQRSLVMSMQFIFGDDWNDAPCSPRFLGFPLFTPQAAQAQDEYVRSRNFQNGRHYNGSSSNRFEKISTRMNFLRLTSFTWCLLASCVVIFPNWRWRNSR